MTVPLYERHRSSAVPQPDYSIRRLDGGSACPGAVGSSATAARDYENRLPVGHSIEGGVAGAVDLVVSVVFHRVDLEVVVPTARKRYA